ncbi:unnamed protein product [Tenebrio molitor]|nr:unnamed protein product [Tenebrio molitor]
MLVLFLFCFFFFLLIDLYLTRNAFVSIFFNSKNALDY